MGTTCPNCGAPVQPQSSFCGKCGAKLAGTSPPIHPASPGYYPQTPAPQPSVSTGAYKAVIAVLMIAIIILGVMWYSTSSGHSLFGPYHYTLSNPPSFQSTQPGPIRTPQTPANVIWNACGSGPSSGCTMSPSGWREGSVPDTFDYYVSFTSSVNVTVFFFTMGQFVQFSVCNGDLSCVSGYYDSIKPTTDTQGYLLFRLGEGCADYLAIYVASGSGVMIPNVGVTYNPSPSTVGPTGYCAQAIGP